MPELVLAVVLVLALGPVLVLVGASQAGRGRNDECLIDDDVPAGAAANSAARDRAPPPASAVSTACDWARLCARAYLAEKD